MTSDPGWAWRMTAAMLHMVPVGKIRAASFPNNLANLFSNFVAVISSRECRSESFLSSASLIALSMSLGGCVRTSLLMSIRVYVYSIRFVRVIIN